jgi:hypothetical protein
MLHSLYFLTKLFKYIQFCIYFLYITKILNYRFIYVYYNVKVLFYYKDLFIYPCILNFIPFIVTISTRFILITLYIVHLKHFLCGRISKVNASILLVFLKLNLHVQKINIKCRYLNFVKINSKLFC